MSLISQLISSDEKFAFTMKGARFERRIFRRWQSIHLRKTDREDETVPYRIAVFAGLSLPIRRTKRLICNVKVAGIWVKMDVIKARSSPRRRKRDCLDLALDDMGFLDSALFFSLFFLLFLRLGSG